MVSISWYMRCFKGKLGDAGTYVHMGWDSTPRVLRILILGVVIMASGTLGGRYQVGRTLAGARQWN